MCECKILFMTENLLVAFIPCLVMDFMKIESRCYSTLFYIPYIDRRCFHSVNVLSCME
jgi:hypothetical protein